jgi:hypothetical protein
MPRGTLLAAGNSILESLAGNKGLGDLGLSPESDLSNFGSATKLRVPHISLVFREMWDTTAFDL